MLSNKRLVAGMYLYTHLETGLEWLVIHEIEKYRRVGPWVVTFAWQKPKAGNRFFGSKAAAVRWLAQYTNTLTTEAARGLQAIQADYVKALAPDDYAQIVALYGAASAALTSVRLPAQAGA